MKNINYQREIRKAREELGIELDSTIENITEYDIGNERLMSKEEFFKFILS